MVKNLFYHEKSNSLTITKAEVSMGKTIEPESCTKTPNREDGSSNPTIWARPIITNSLVEVNHCSD